MLYQLQLSMPAFTACLSSCCLTLITMSVYLAPLGTDGFKIAGGSQAVMFVIGI